MHVEMGDGFRQNVNADPGKAMMVISRATPRLACCGEKVMCAKASGLHIVSATRNVRPRLISGLLVYREVHGAGIDLVAQCQLAAAIVNVNNLAFCRPAGQGRVAKRGCCAPKNVVPIAVEHGVHVDRARLFFSAM